MYLRANDTDLYYEVRGSGPSLLLMMGATGDGGALQRFAESLADEFEVITYDRRGNGRSHRPPGWNSTSPEEQADDAAALLTGLGLAPAAIFGTSSAGVFALEMLIRHPEAVCGAVLHEPALFSLFNDPQDVRDTLRSLIEGGMRAGGPPAAMERFVRFVAGDANWECLGPSVRARMLGSAETYFGVESGAFDAFMPDKKTLDAIDSPIQLLVSEASLPAFSEAAGRLAERLGVEVTRTPGTHFPYLDHPDELANVVRPFIRRITA